MIESCRWLEQTLEQRVLRDERDVIDRLECAALEDFDELKLCDAHRPLRQRKCIVGSLDAFEHGQHGVARAHAAGICSEQQRAHPDLDNFARLAAIGRFNLLLGELDRIVKHAMRGRRDETADAKRADCAEADHNSAAPPIRRFATPPQHDLASADVARV